jgi:lysophospholipase L1-like esterase
MRGVIFDEIAKKYKTLTESAANLFGLSNKVEIKNHSRFGQTSAHIMDRLPAMLEAESDLVLIELGNNDCDKKWEEVIADPDTDHESIVPFETFKNNIRTIIENIRKAGKKPVVMTLHPIDGDRYFDFIAHGDQGRANNLIKFLGDKNLIYRTQERYAEALERIAVAAQVPTVPLRERLLSVHKYSDYMCSDGIHLNQRGQELVKQVCDERYLEYVKTGL